MTTQDNNFVKILFRFYNDIFEEEMTESMWATVIDEYKGLYKLDNIPFYAPGVASDDILLAEFDAQEQMLTYRRTVEYSGNSTIQVVLMDKTIDINTIRDFFRELGCVSEKANKGYFSMKIPASVDYKIIKQKLDDMETRGIIGYAEPCLASRNRQ